MEIVYDSMNTGGRWPLSEMDWFNLDIAGWRVVWVSEYPNNYSKSAVDNNGKYMGQLATFAVGEFDSIEEAKENFFKATGKFPDDPGCPCCGPPHSFWEGDGFIGDGTTQ